MKFELDQRLQNDSFFVYKLPLSQVRLINDRQFIWCVLIPEINNITEIIELNEVQQAALWQESAMLSRALQKGFHPDKLNVAAIGNIVSQLHVHHLCRFKVDIAWPAPVWGRQPMVGYEENKNGMLSEKISKLLKEQQSL
ncbi:MAG: diadenosine tetraphosphate (Ap4A) HIT family hydrolase [Glaciecola sp.]